MWYLYCDFAVIDLYVATNGYRGQWRVNNYKERICNVYCNTQPLLLGYSDVTLSANRIIWTNHGRCRFIFELPLSFVYYPLYTGKRSSLFHVCRFLCSGIVAWSCWVLPVLSRSCGCSVNKCKWDYRCGSHEVCGTVFFLGRNTETWKLVVVALLDIKRSIQGFPVTTRNYKIIKSCCICKHEWHYNRILYVVPFLLLPISCRQGSRVPWWIICISVYGTKLFLSS